MLRVFNGDLTKSIVVRLLAHTCKNLCEIAIERRMKNLVFELSAILQTHVYPRDVSICCKCKTVLGCQKCHQSNSIMLCNGCFCVLCYVCYHEYDRACDDCRGNIVGCNKCSHHALKSSPIWSSVCEICETRCCDTCDNEPPRTCAGCNKKICEDCIEWEDYEGKCDCELVICQECQPKFLIDDCEECGELICIACRTCSDCGHINED